MIVRLYERLVQRRRDKRGQKVSPPKKRFENVVDFELAKRQRQAADELAEKGVEPKAVRNSRPDGAA